MLNDAGIKLPELAATNLDSDSARDQFRDTVILPGLYVEPRIARPEIPKVTLKQVAGGQAAWLSLKSPAKETANEDSVAAFSISAEEGLLVVADGLGGHRGGRKASQMVIKSLQRGVKRIQTSCEPDIYRISNAVIVPSNSSSQTPLTVQAVALEQIEYVNSRLLKNGSGSATTIALVEIKGDKARSYHVGDSEIFFVSQRGRMKHETVSHSPVSYALQAGLLTEHEAMRHEERHLVSNVVGSGDMSIDLGPWVTLSIRDTVLLASDGLFDNLTQSEIVNTIRIGRLDESVQKLAELTLDRMTAPLPGQPSKCDDLTILAFRRTVPKSKNGNHAPPETSD